MNGPNTFVGTRKSTVVNRPADDWYSINVASTASTLRLETGTPGDGPGEFVNILNPRIELYDPSNVLGAITPADQHGVLDYLAGADAY